MMDLEFWANIAQILSLPISIIAIFVGGKAINKVNKVLNIRKNNEINRNKIIDSKVEKNTTKNNTRATKHSNIISYTYNGLNYSDVDTIIDNKFEKVKNTINSIEELKKILEKNYKYSIPVIWSGSQIEYDEMKKNGEILSEVIYMINED